ncbi:MAG: helix-turn-helix transcriptional regulator [Acidobacteria bacterium]|nr:helix-turn-helix transcriptional regulator [Acidobacteriota bacterium]
MRRYLDTEPACLVDLRRHLGLAIRSHRRGVGWTQERLAEAAGLSPEHICRLERGLATPSLRTLCAISETLGVSVEELFFGGARQGGCRLAASHNREQSPTRAEMVRFLETLVEMLRGDTRITGM